MLRDTPGSQFVRVAIAPDRGTGVLEYLCEESLRVLVMDGRLHDGLSVFVVDDGWFDKLSPASEDEEDMLDLAFGLTHTSRLGCQIRMSDALDGLVVRLPAATRNMMVDK